MLLIRAGSTLAGCPSPHEVGGRGLFLVRQLADDWGQYGLPPSATRHGADSGKVIWFTCEARE